MNLKYSDILQRINSIKISHKFYMTPAEFKRFQSSCNISTVFRKVNDFTYEIYINNTRILIEVEESLALYRDDLPSVHMVRVKNNNPDNPRKIQLVIIKDE